MLKIQKIITILTIAFIFENQTFSQQFATFGLGSSVTQVISNVFVKRFIDVKTTPVFIGNWEYYLGNNLSIGIGGSYQFFSYNFSSDTLNVSMNLNKFNFSVFGRYYYKQTDKFGIYSQLRGGISFWNYSLNNDFTKVLAPIKFIFKFFPIDLSKAFDGTVKFNSLQFTIVGMNTNFSKKFSAYAELSIGSPYWTVFGLKYKFKE